MTPEYVNELADLADPDELWTLAARVQIGLSPHKRRQLDAGIALRRYAAYLERLRETLRLNKSLLITPLSANGIHSSVVPTPDDVKELRDVQRAQPLNSDDKMELEITGSPPRAPVTSNMTTIATCPTPDRCRIEAGPSVSTCVHYPPVYDGNGNNLNPDANTSHTPKRCLTCGMST